MKHSSETMGLVAKFPHLGTRAIGGEHGDVLLCVLGYGMLYNHAKAPKSAAQGLSEPWMWDDVWVNYNELTASSLEIIVSKGNHPQMALIQVSELL